ncbi:chromate efflux transporter [Fodinicurvata halophila]|uniref:Chromate efflux transporter n=1 Tax=Fodinicurvata halophila TaxID=1419723 RepID=A0ABV8UHC2_9PROT
MTAGGDAHPLPERTKGSWLEVFLIFLRLGLTSFGGPVAHLGYFREAFVSRRGWFSEKSYGDLVALCQFLPGPASSQVGLSIGLARAGLPGALAAWTAFTLPSALLLTVFGYGILVLGSDMNGDYLRGLKAAAVAVVAHAVWGMGRSLCPDRERLTLAVAGAILLVVWPHPLGQVGVILAGGLIGWLFLKSEEERDYTPLDITVPRSLAIAALGVFFLLLAGLPLLAGLFPGQTLALFDSFYRSGALVFGGGHVVLPLLQAEVVPTGWIDEDSFLAGYGAAQAVPGPLFTFAAYLGTVMEPVPNGVLGAAICLVAIFLPSFLLVIGVLPFWEQLRHVQPMRRALLGVNAAVVGLLLAALYHPVWTSGVRAPSDFALVLGAFTLLAFWRLPAWLVVILAAAAGAGLELLA